MSSFPVCYYGRFSLVWWGPVFELDYVCSSHETSLVEFLVTRLLLLCWPPVVRAGVTSLRVFTIKEIYWEKSMEGEATMLVPARLARKETRIRRYQMKYSEKLFDKGNRQGDLWKPKQVR